MQQIRMSDLQIELGLTDEQLNEVAKFIFGADENMNPGSTLGYEEIRPVRDLYMLMEFPLDGRPFYDVCDATLCVNAKPIGEVLNNHFNRIRVFELIDQTKPGYVLVLWNQDFVIIKFPEIASNVTIISKRKKRT